MSLFIEKHAELLKIWNKVKTFVKKGWKFINQWKDVHLKRLLSKCIIIRLMLVFTQILKGFGFKVCIFAIL